MERLGIRTGRDLKAQSLPFLKRNFGKAGPYYYWLSRGIDDRPVCADRVRKSISAENTFLADLFTVEEAREALKPLVEKVWEYCDRANIRGRTVILKAKFADFQQVTRSRTCQSPIATQAAVEDVVNTLAQSLFPVRKGVRLLGVTLASLAEKSDASTHQMRLSL
jgi:DNA polymerase-4